MRYQVGRACAVAGYVDLYRELELLPEVHIAEEARDNSCTEIYDLIRAHDVKYDVMNDYTLTVNLENPPRGQMNGDTAVGAHRWKSNRRIHAKDIRLATSTSQRI